MASKSIEIKGLDRLNRVLAVGGRHALTAVGRAIYMEANKVFAESQMQVPVDTGALRASGMVSRPTQTAKSVEVQISYGGTAAGFDGEVGYAAIVHENLGAHHEVGKAKYLEDPVTEAAPEFAERVADSVDKTLRSIR